VTERADFFATIRARLATPASPNPAHPMPPPLTDGIPVVHSSLVDPDDLVGSFERNALALRAFVHRVDAATIGDDLLRDIVANHGVRRVVVSRDPEAVEVGKRLTALGLDVSEVSTPASAEADLGVTTAAAALAATGSVLQDSGRSGGRTASLLPPVHLCLVPASRIVPSTAEVLRTLGDGRSLPSNLVLITGPSRSGDIELAMALGVHGPPRVELVVLLRA
jgi:L-lactate dehydrogenase complex protein LldG